MIKEACVENFNEALIAVKKGADRLELCADLANDGLTPSVELIKSLLRNPCAGNDHGKAKGRKLRLCTRRD